MIKSIFLVIFFISSGALNASGNYRNVENALLDFINDTRFSRVDMLDFIQSKPFVHKGYRFEYDFSESYLNSKKQDYFKKMKPEGVAKIEPATTKNKIKLRWTTLDNPTPGTKSDFIISFSYEVNESGLPTNKEEVLNKSNLKSSLSESRSFESESMPEGSEELSTEANTNFPTEKIEQEPKKVAARISQKPPFLKKPDRYEVHKPKFYLKETHLELGNEEQVTKLIEQYHAIDRTDRTKLRLRIQALDAIQKKADELGIENLKMDTSSKRDYLEKLDAMFIDMGYTPDGERNWRKGVLWFVKKYIGIGSKGLGFSIGGYPLMPNQSSLIFNEILQQGPPELLSKYSDPYGRDLTDVIPLWQDSKLDFFLHLEDLVYNDMASPGSTKVLGWVPRGDMVSKHTNDRMLDIQNGLLIETLGTNKGKPATGINSIYAIDQFGGLHVTSYTEPHHHPGFTWGLPVICAGHIKVENGKIIEINNTSGHYSPTLEHLYYGVKILYEKGVIPDGTLIYGYGEGALKVEEFVKEYRPKNERDYWKFKVLDPENYFNQGFKSLVKVINADRVLKEMILEEAFRISQARQKLKDVSKAFKLRKKE